MWRKQKNNQNKLVNADRKLQKAKALENGSMGESNAGALTTSASAATDAAAGATNTSKYHAERTWAELAAEHGLEQRLTKAIAKQGWVRPTLVQAEMLPLAFKGKDLLVRARTGSGKTGAFAVPTLHKLLLSKAAADAAAPQAATPATRAVVLVPTRELCEQVRRHMWELMFYARDVLSLLALVGNDDAAQRAQLVTRPDVVIATPARLAHHLAHLTRVAADGGKKRSGDGGDGGGGGGALAMLDALRTSVETLVIDEADLVLSFGHGHDVNKVLSHLPKTYQGFLMSATLSEDLALLKRVALRAPVTLKLEEGDGGLGGGPDGGGKLLQFFLEVVQ